MKKRFMGLILVALLLVSAIVPAYAYADDADSVLGTFNGTVVYLKGNANSQNADKMVSLLIADKKASKVTPQSIKYIYQFKTDSDGKYNISLNMLNITDMDNYRLVLKTSDGNDITYSLKEASSMEVYNIDLYGVLKDGEYSANVKIKNIYSTAGEYKAIVAFYSNESTLLDCEIRAVSVNDGDYNMEFKINAPNNAEKAKIMLWKDFVNMTPLSISNNSKNSYNLYLISDSLCTIYDKSAAPQTGWGQCIEEMMSENCNVVNYALGGYGLKDLYGLKYPLRKDNLSQWDKIMNGYSGNPAISSGDFVIISSNINDGKNYKLYVRSNGKKYKFSDQTGKNFIEIRDDGSYDNSKTYTLDELDNATDFEILYNAKSEIAEYKEYLNRMISEVRQKGATPIVVGSTGVSDDNSYKTVARSVALDNNVTYIDVGCIINKYYSDLQTQKGTDVHETFHLKSKGDNLHYCDTGAKLVANTIAMLLKKSNSALGKYVDDSVSPYIDNDADYGLGSGTFNKYYNETADRHFK